MILDSTAPELELKRDFSFRWGRSGHCAGSVWYDISCEGKKLFFSGDYRSDDPFYVCDDAEGKTADVAVLDAAYPGDRTGQICAGRFLIKYWNWCGGESRFFFLCRISAGDFPSRHISVIKEVWRFPCIWLPGFMTNGCVWGGGNTSPAGKCLPFPMKRFPYGTENDS